MLFSFAGIRMRTGTASPWLILVAQQPTGAIVGYGECKNDARKRVIADF